MDEIEDADGDIDDGKLLFIGGNKEKFNFNTFSIPLSFLSDIYNGKTSLKEVEFNQRNLEKRIEDLKFGYEPKKKKEKEEINGVLMQANNLLEYRKKIIDAFKDGTFLSEHLRELDNAAYDFMLNYVKEPFKKLNRWKKKLA